MASRAERFTTTARSSTSPPAPGTPKSPPNRSTAPEPRSRSTLQTNQPTNQPTNNRKPTTMTNPQKIWHPAPRGLVIAAATERWTRERPAPDLVVYLWTWSQFDDGERPTRRQLARLFGWTEHHARTLLTRIKADHAAWLEAHPPTLKQSRRPGPPRNGADLRPPAAQEPPRNNQEPPDRARVSTTHSQHTTGPGQVPGPVTGGRSWHRKP